MPSIVHITTTLHCRSGMPADDVVNGFTFTGPGVTSVVAAAAKVAVKAFWQDGGHLCDLLAPSISRAAKISFKSYELSSTSGAAPDVRIPAGFGHPFDVSDEFFHTSGELSSVGLPQQIALCLSYRTDYGTSVEHEGAGPRPAERKRGRIFLGPWNDSTSNNFSGPPDYQSAPNHLLSLAIGHAGQALLGAAPAAIFGVWSRKDNLVRPVTQMWVDDRWDTQRRRDLLPDSRLAFDASTVLV